MPGFFVFIPWIDARRAGVPEGVFEVAKSLIPLVFPSFPWSPDYWKHSPATPRQLSLCTRVTPLVLARLRSDQPDGRIVHASLGLVIVLLNRAFVVRFARFGRRIFLAGHGA
jgi:hypothetical protein